MARPNSTTLNMNKFLREKLEGMKVQQKCEGDCLPSGYVSNLPERVKIEVKDVHLEELWEYWNKIPEFVRVQFIKRFGRIMYLLKIPVQGAAIITLIQYWDPSYRVFTIKDMDITPTLEEYGVLIGLPIESGNKIYINARKIPSMERVAQILGAKLQDVTAKKRTVGNRLKLEGWSKDFILSYLRQYKEQKRWDMFIQVAGLLIYGLVLFPSVMDFVDLYAIDVFVEVLSNNVNPVPAILADTFLNLNYCRRNQNATLRCCSSLLFVWICSHVFSKNANRLSYWFVDRPCPLQKFDALAVPQLNKAEWAKEYDKLDSSNFMWRASWLSTKSAIIQCGDFHQVPLLGPRGLIAYAPTMVLRQLGYQQRIPITKSLSEIEVLYHEEKAYQDLVKEVQQAWKNVTIIEDIEHEYRQGGVAAGYTWWFQQRGKNIRIPSDTHAKVTSNPSQKLEDENKMQSLAISDLEETVKRLSGEKRKWEEMQGKLYSQYLQADEERKQNMGISKRLKADNEELESKLKAFEDMNHYFKKELQTINNVAKNLEEMFLNTERRNRVLTEKNEALLAVIENKDKEINALQEEYYRMRAAFEKYGKPTLQQIQHLKYYVKDALSTIVPFKEPAKECTELIDYCIEMLDTLHLKQFE